ncbi:sulfatase [Roseibacillus ishigakijimensis]|uniref:Sulfatase n=1 Tax=Roseibacillus ishigakijimensis TaxID=454146 RepID=A0A934RPW1_9BACT|nr:sulfatase [Roseibacillus ishigakijimensis]MBK1833667.1 sulfatase [Roseibacillus ishigakijimensis]
MPSFNPPSAPHSSLRPTLAIWLLFLGAIIPALAKAPNLILIYADDLGYGDLGCYGSEEIHSPHLDRLASEGLRFTDFYATSASCTPSRAALMTASYPGRVGLNNVLMPESKDKKTGKHLGLNPSEITLAEILRDQGYATALVGKWHLGDHPEFLPTNHGFEHFFGLPYSNDMVPPRFVDLPLMRNEEVIAVNPDQDLITRRYTEESLRFIEENKDQPFFLFLSHSMPHRPCHASEPFTKRFSKEQLAQIKPGEDKASRDFLYPAAVEEIDWSAGQILTKLAEVELESNTLILFTSDNGPKVGSAGPLRGLKGSNYEGGHRVPGIMRWPDRIPAGSTTDEIATTMDLLPTMAHLLGVKLPDDRVLDGHNILPLLENPASAQSPYRAYFYTHGPLGVRVGPWKLLGRGKQAALYNLETDLKERTNLLKKHPEVVARLEKEREAFRASLKAHSRLAGVPQL